MSLSAVRLAMMDRYGDITGAVVPDDPIPMQIEDMSIIIFPRLEESTPISKGKALGSVALRNIDVMQIEYHRRIPYEEIGSVLADVTTMIDTIRDVAWLEHANGKFDGTILSIDRVVVAHFGAIGWNEWTFGARLEVTFTHLSEVPT